MTKLSPPVVIDVLSEGKQYMHALPPGAVRWEIVGRDAPNQPIKLVAVDAAGHELQIIEYASGRWSWVNARSWR